jgi:arginyl-tRNA synthetase
MTVTPATVISPLVSAAIEAAFGEQFAGTDPVLRPSQFADVQVNAALALAKRLGRPPREVAQQIADHLDVADVCSSVAISGPGFLNLQVADDWVARQVSTMARDKRAGVPLQRSLRVVIDYSAPNVAKEMHVGHLRTTVVGDALARTLQYLGHTVIRQNHIGDWGTPFGMLIEHLLDVGEGTAEARLLETDPNAFYQAARGAFETDAAFARRARARVVLLQSGDVATVALWRELVGLSRLYFNRIYAALGVTLTDDDLAGESSYNDRLAGVCEELESAGIATVSDGALCVFLDGYVGREGRPLPLIIRKSDGGYGYATTDLATIRHRVGRLQADRILYVVGAPQALHFDMVWATARRAGWLPEPLAPTHVRIGNVLGDDRKILRTRSGSPLRLMALLDEAVTHARRVLDTERVELDPRTRDVLAPQIGIGAIKYADLRVGHDSDYVFDLDRMVALTGDTGGYVQYAAARIRSIFRTAALAPEDASAAINPSDPAERALALELLRYGEVVAQVGDRLEPHQLCAYLFGVAQGFSVFYERCPVLKGEGPSRDSRLALCALTLRVLVSGLGLLGIAAPERM